MPTFTYKPAAVEPEGDRTPASSGVVLSQHKPFFVPTPLQSYKSAGERLAEHAREWNYIKEVPYKPYARVAGRSGKMCPLSTKRDNPDGSFWLDDGGYPANRRSFLFIPVIAPRSWKSAKWSGKGQADTEHMMTLMQQGRLEEAMLWAKVPAYEVIACRFQTTQEVDKILLYGLEDFNYPARGPIAYAAPFLGAGAKYETDEMVQSHQHYVQSSDPMGQPDVPDYYGWGRCIAINSK